MLMRRTSLQAAAATLTAALCGCVSPGGAGNTPPTPFDAGLDAVAAKYGLRKTWFSVRKENGETISSVRGDSMGIGRPLRIGSLSKSVTAVGIALLVQDKRLTLQTRLGDILPAYVKAKGHQLDPSLATIDIEHLLAHRAGLRTNYSSDKANGLSSAAALARMAPDAHFSEYMFATNSDHSDGTQGYRYSNLSYLVLGMVIEAVSGLPYEVFCQQRILAAVGVSGSIAPVLRRVAPIGGWEMTAPDALRLWTVFDVNHPTLLSRATLETTLLSRALPPIAAGSSVHYTTAAYVRQGANRDSYVVSHNGIADFIRGEPNVYAFAEKYVPGDSWIYVYETAPGDQSKDMRAIIREVRALVEPRELRS